ncbi:MAG: membrane protein insertion efficiency factor YidD [Verrucomicrobia bacterium]|nr:membrane protein insertion efficiency factor YidD [Verrucomicrobiota bacterium]
MNPAQHILVAALRLYQWAVSPLVAGVFGPLARCRFQPTCSAYALEAVRIHGALRGTWLAICRLGRCHPWGGCGHDPVPPRRTNIVGGPPVALSSIHPSAGGLTTGTR